LSQLPDATGEAQMKLERTANMALIVACLLVSAQVGRNLYNDHKRPTSSTQLKIGDRIRDTPDVKLSSVRASILLLTRSDCKYCTESMPAFQKISAEGRRVGFRVVAAASRESPTTNRQYLDSYNVPIDAAVAASTIGVGGPTPLLLIVDRTGTIRGAWLGLMNETREREVLAAIAGT
jgi:peroxiredoxin